MWCDLQPKEKRASQYIKTQYTIPSVQSESLLYTYKTVFKPRSVIYGVPGRQAIEVSIQLFTKLRITHSFFVSVLYQPIKHVVSHIIVIEAPETPRRWRALSDIFGEIHGVWFLFLSSEERKLHRRENEIENAREWMELRGRETETEKFWWADEEEEDLWLLLESTRTEEGLNRSFGLKWRVIWSLEIETLREGVFPGLLSF